jgi:general secretion pathway protein K
MSQNFDTRVLHSLKSKNKSGVALLLVMVALALLTVIAYEIAFTSRVEQRIGKNARDRVQASYLARSAARFGLLRLNMYKEIYNLKLGGQIPKEAISDEIIDRVWNMPFPPFPFEGSKVEWPGTLSQSISSEGSKIPINLLDGNIYRKSSKDLQTQVREELQTLFKGLMEDEEFSKEYRDIDTNELIDNLQDWIDKDSDRVGGGDENSLYDDDSPAYFPRNDRISTLSELHMVKGWTEDLVKRLSPNFSVINTGLTLNPNYIPLQRLQSFHKDLTPQDLLIIQARRLEKPFADLKALQEFISSSGEVKNGRDFKFPKDYKSSTTERIFYIDANATVGDARRTLRIGVRIDDEAKPVKTNPDGTTDPPATGGTGANSTSPAKMKVPVVITIEEKT